MTELQVLLNIAAAMAFGTLIGAERQWQQRMAGLRTNALVCVGSALYVSLSMLMDDPSPSRIAAQVVSGIGFLGTGVIFKEGVNVRGLNTAATLWCSGAVGVLAGSSLLVVAAAGTVCVLLANMTLKELARRINRLSPRDIEKETTYRLCIVCRAAEESHVRQLLLNSLTAASAVVCGLFSEDLPDNKLARVWADLTTSGRHDSQMEQFINRLGVEPGVTSISWQAVEPDSHFRDLAAKVNQFINNEQNQ